MGRTRGFTLIELLVVIAIIAILAAILFPVFARAREKARQTSCLSNIKQLVLGVQMYAQDYDQFLPMSITGGYGQPGKTNENRCWWGEAVLQPYLKNRQIFHCPSGAYTSSTYPAYAPNNNFSWNGGSLAITDLASPAGSSYFADVAQLGTSVLGNLDPTTWLEHETGYSHHNWYPPQNRTGSLSTPYYEMTNSSDYRRRPVPRHNGGLNVAYLDGHAKWLSITQFLGPMPNGHPYGDPNNSWDRK